MKARIAAVVFSSLAALTPCQERPWDATEAALLVRLRGLYEKPLRLAYTVELRDRSGQLEEVRDFKLVGTAPSWCFEMTERDAEQRISRTTIVLADEVYTISREREGWLCTREPRNKNATYYCAFCPIHSTFLGIEAMTWPRVLAAHPVMGAELHAESGGWRLLTVDLELESGVAQRIDKDEFQSGTLGYRLCWMLADGLTQLRSIMHLATPRLATGSSADGAIEWGPNMRKLVSHGAVDLRGRKGAAVITRVIEFGSWQEVGTTGLQLPLSMTITGDAGEAVVACEIQPESFRWDDLMDVEFRVPAEFGSVGRIVDKETRRARYFGRWNRNAEAPDAVRVPTGGRSDAVGESPVSTLVFWFGLGCIVGGVLMLFGRTRR